MPQGVHTTATTATTSATVNTIPCCLCGTLITPNAANQCSSCLAQNFNLQALLQGNDKGDPLIIHQCRQCRRFARTETYYEFCEPESPRLLSICLKHIPALNKRGHSSNKLHLIDSIWIWTEPHSMRLKVRVTIRTEIEQVTVQQRVPVVFEIKWKMCSQCNREFTNRTWHAMVQLRQKRNHSSTAAPRKGLAALEMALRRNKDIRRNVLKMDVSRHGFDFYFLSLSEAQQFAQFLQRLAPIKVKTSSKLVSADTTNNTANMKYTLTCDMVPLCREDLVLVHKESRSKLGGRLALVSKVASSIHLIDASPQRGTVLTYMEVTADGYHKAGGADRGYTVMQTSDRLIRFVVLDVELCQNENNNNNNPPANMEDDDKMDRLLYQGPSSSGVDKYALADVLLARESDMGNNDAVLSCVTHLGNLLQPGDIVLGYDLVSTAANLSTTIASASSTSSKSSSFMGASSVVELEEVLNSNVVLQDVILVKKISAKEQRDIQEATDAANASDGVITTRNVSNVGEGGEDDDNDDDEVISRQKTKGVRNPKKKLRRQQKQDKKRRELEESATRMGFLDDLAEAQAPFLLDDDEEEEDIEFDGNEYSFSEQLQNDPELAADIEDVERELAKSYPSTIPEEEDVVDGEEEKAVADDTAPHDKNGTAEGHVDDALK